MKAAPALLLAVLAGCAGARRCPAPESYAPLRVPDWSGAPFDVGYIGRAPNSCPGKLHPVVSASHPKADAWIQLFEAEGNTKVDAAKHDGPFYIRGREFWDNPGWSPPAKTLVWTAWTFPVKIEGRRVVPLGGFRWGFRWEPAQTGPAPEPLSPAGREAWRRLKPELAKYGDWSFSD